MPGFEITSWFGLLAPARTSPEIVGRLNAELLKVQALPDVKAALGKLGFDSVSGTPEQFAEHIRREVEKFIVGIQVVDFMASWDSHLPDGLNELSVTGLGMNADELAQNPRLEHRVVHDVNTGRALPFDDNRFDAVICTVSVEYLVKPVAVFRELGRVLKPGAMAIITFSDRWFPTKVITLWTELHPFERVALVQEYFRSAGNFNSLETGTVHGLPRPQDDKYAQQRAFSDPVFAVRAVAAR